MKKEETKQIKEETKATGGEEMKEETKHRYLKIIALMISVGVVITITYLLWNPSKVFAPKEQEKKKEETHQPLKGELTYNRKTQSNEDLYQKFRQDKTYEGTFADYVLTKQVIPSYAKKYVQEGKKEVEEYIAEQKKHNRQVKFTKKEKERMVSQRNENTVLLAMYKEAIGDIDKEVNKVYKAGFEVGEYVQLTMRNKAKVEEVKKMFYGLEGKKEILKFLEENREGNPDYIVDVIDYYPYNVTEGMRKFLDLKVGENAYIEEGSYYVMVKKVDSRTADKQEVYSKLYDHKLLTDYGSSSKLLKGINGKYKDFQYKGDLEKYFEQEKKLSVEKTSK